MASVDQIQAILPDLSTSFIIAAVAHPYFTAPPPSGAPATSVEERIIEAIFDSAPLPDALNDLLSAPSASLHDSDPSSSAGLTTSDAENEAHLMELARARRQQAEEATGGAVDPSQIYHKDTSDVVPPMSDAVPQSVRESIMRLVEVQREEQEEEEREERERQASRRAAAGKVKLDAKQATSRPNEDDDLEEEEHVSARMRGTAAIGADGEASGDDEDEDAARDVSLLFSSRRWNAGADVRPPTCRCRLDRYLSTRTACSRTYTCTTRKSSTATARLDVVRSARHSRKRRVS